jgi:threonyl-tRNA synthetase
VTPVLARLDLYKQSGHYQKFADTMFPPMRTEDGEELELRPMNCPHHMLVYESELRSYRELPLRIAEIGNMYRWEKSGELMGMIRVRSIALNDAHIFCTPEQLQDEILGAIELAQHFMRTLGVKIHRYRLSVRDGDPSKWFGSDEHWASAEAALARALDSIGQPYDLGVGEAAFYGPKIDFQILDAQRREFTNNTVQVDFEQPERFNLEYVAADGTRQRPVMVHRGALGAMERMVAYLIEHYAGAFPTWLAPVQVAVLPITDAHAEYAREVAAQLRRRRIRVEVDDRSERLNKKIAEAQARKVPYMAVVGGREAEARTVQVRNRAGEQSSEPLDAFTERLVEEIAEKRL